MPDDKSDHARQRAVPASRLARLSSFGRLAGGVASGMMAEGARRLASGEGINPRDLILTPGNAKRMTERLAHLRGAAMKMGQMISLDSGDFLPPELANILATLRDQANFMPARQLDGVLKQEWGSDWRKQFRWFNPRPIAAASIGQVHKALTRDGREVAIKVQYPGVAQSIDSDVDNVMALLKFAGFTPPELEIDALLVEAKKQLHEEADYLREGEQMRLYAERLAGVTGFVVPALYEDLTTERILAMSFEDGVPIEQLSNETPQRRDQVFAGLLHLVARELFEFGVMQTDPNFANYRFRPDSGEIVLLDFGACRAVDPDIANAYRRLITAGLDQDREQIKQEAVAAGFMHPLVVERYGDKVDRMIEIVVSEMSQDAPFDFGDRGFVPELRDQGMAIAQDKETWILPPIETLFVQRKVSGTALLGARLKAVANIRRIVEEVFESTDPW